MIPFLRRLAFCRDVPIMGVLFQCQYVCPLLSETGGKEVLIRWPACAVFSLGCSGSFACSSSSSRRSRRPRQSKTARPWGTCWSTCSATSSRRGAPQSSERKQHVSTLALAAYREVLQKRIDQCDAAIASLCQSNPQAAMQKQTERQLWLEALNLFDTIVVP